jgi:hypothetical protein
MPLPTIAPILMAVTDGRPRSRSSCFPIVWRYRLVSCLRTSPRSTRSRTLGRSGTRIGCSTASQLSNAIRCRISRKRAETAGKLDYYETINVDLIETDERHSWPVGSQLTPYTFQSPVSSTGNDSDKNSQEFVRRHHSMATTHRRLRCGLLNYINSVMLCILGNLLFWSQSMKLYVSDVKEAPWY